MYESSQSTILKCQLLNIKMRNKIIDSNQQTAQTRVDDSRQCYTPILKAKNNIMSDNNTNGILSNSTDQLQDKKRIGKYYYSCNSQQDIKHYENVILSSQQDINNKNPQVILLNNNDYDTTNNNVKYSTPNKKKNEIIKTTQSQSNQYLFINTKAINSNNNLNTLQQTQQNHHSPQQIIAIQQQLLKQLTIAKRQAQRLNSQNLKLRLQKIKLTSKPNKTQTVKLIPLKIQCQNLKKEIEKLLQQKQLLLMNRQYNDKGKQGSSHKYIDGNNNVSSNISSNQCDLLINGTQFKVLKHIPGSVYSTNSNNSQLQQQKSKISSFIAPTNNNPPIYNNNSNNNNNPPPPTNNNSNQSIRKYISSNNQSIKNFFKLQNQQQTSKSSTFIKYAKQSLKTGQKSFYINYNKSINNNINNMSINNNNNNIDNNNENDNRKTELFRQSRQRQTNISATNLNKTFDNNHNNT